MDYWLEQKKSDAYINASIKPRYTGVFSKETDKAIQIQIYKDNKPTEWYEWFPKSATNIESVFREEKKDSFTKVNEQLNKGEKVMFAKTKTATKTIEKLSKKYNLKIDDNGEMTQVSLKD